MKIAELAARVGLSETQTMDLLRVVNLVPDDGEIVEHVACQTFIAMAGQVDPTADTQAQPLASASA